MGCKFITMTSKDIKATFEYALQEAPTYNVEFQGDSNGGRFSLTVLNGRISGSFRSTADRIEWQIDQKPIFIPCKLIQSFIQQYV